MMPAHTVSVEACDVVLEREVWPGTTLRARCMGHVPGREGPHQYRLADAVLVAPREGAGGVVMCELLTGLRPYPDGVYSRRNEQLVEQPDSRHAPHRASEATSHASGPRARRRHLPHLWAAGCRHRRPRPGAGTGRSGRREQPQGCAPCLQPAQGHHDGPHATTTTAARAASGRGGGVSAQGWGGGPSTPSRDHVVIAAQDLHAASSCFSKVCRYCGTSIQSARAFKCDREECRKAHNRTRMREYAKRKFEETGESIHASERRKGRTRTIRYCVDCGDRIWPHGGIEKAERCKPCGDAFKRRNSRREAVAAAIQIAADGRVGTVVWTAGNCADCGTQFVARRAGVRFCSRACNRRAKARAHKQRNPEKVREAKHRRRALKRGAFVAQVNRKEIFKRDGGRCQLCGKKVRAQAKAPHPLSPTLDHIVPLALGGTHEPSNVQLAHFLCNALKSATPAGDQLRLAV